MASQYKKIRELKQELERAQRDLEYSRECRKELETKVEKYKGDEDKRLWEATLYREKLEGEVQWLRRLVELITVPKEKLSAIGDAVEAELRKRGNK